MPAQQPDAPPEAIQPAATVLICRDSAAGPEVLMIQRHLLSNVHGGSYVFPGGKIDPADARLDPAAHLDQPAERLHALLCEQDTDAATAAAIHVGAVREVFEECGLLFAQDAGGDVLRQAAALAAAGVSFNDLSGRLGLRLDTRALRPWSRWVTPLLSLSSPGKRFDTRFFIARVPPGQAARHDAHEAVHSAWLRPRAALESYWRGDIVLAAPQIMSLAHLGRFDSVEAMLAEADSRPPCLVRPHTFEIEGMRATAYPGDERHPERARVMPGPLRLVLRGRRLEPPDGFDGLWR